jgi:hypothetical protein
MINATQRLKTVTQVVAVFPYYQNQIKEGEAF